MRTVNAVHQLCTTYQIYMNINVYICNNLFGNRLWLQIPPGVYIYLYLFAITGLGTGSGYGSLID